jgi:hypothetical protein
MGVLQQKLDLIAYSDQGGVIGGGLLRLASNEKIVNFWNFVQKKFELSMKRFDNITDVTYLTRVPTEQTLINRSFKRSRLSTALLSACKYPNGNWYDGGINADKDGNGTRKRELCGRGSGPVVIQNNFIVGNEAKVRRMQRWGHWFVQLASASVATGAGGAVLTGATAGTGAATAAGTCIPDQLSVARRTVKNKRPLWT